MIQGSDEWLQARCGLVTASRIADVIAKTKTGESTSRANYRAQIVAERLTGKPAESYTNAAMQHGTETEPYARMAYEAHSGNIVKEVGLILHPEIKGAGASPDGLIDDDGLAEIKCPNTATHIDYLITATVPSKYKPQMAWQLACSERKWCEFISFDDRMPEGLQLFVIRYEPEEGYIEMITEEVNKFLAEAENLIEQLQRKVA